MDHSARYPIGELARLSGLTPKALRHYDQLGLLTPVAFSAQGYRLYSQEQLGRARRISRLRELDLPLETVRELLVVDDSVARARLVEHRRRLQARDARIHRAIHALTHLIDDERGLDMALNDPGDTGSSEDERSLAAQLFNQTWELLQHENRSPRDDDRMIHLAHASRFHWDNVGTDQHRAVGEWQVSRVYATLGHGASAVHHARRAVEYAGGEGIDDWVLASAYEGLSRAFASAGDQGQAQAAKARAVQLLTAIVDDDDRAIIQADIDSLPQ